MKSFHLETKINAPIHRVFDLARSIDLHIEGAAHSSEKAIEGLVHGLVEVDDQIKWQAKHFGLTMTMRVKITSIDLPNNFADEMIEGPFVFFRHLHEFVANGQITTMADNLQFEAPFGVIGSITESLFLKRHLFNFLRTKNQLIKKIAEGGDYQKYLNIERCVI